jgi:hypothetical protein
MADYKAEFPDFESEIPAVFLAAPWVDGSWHNDATPSFFRKLADGREIHVYVDEADPALREPEGSVRYSACLTNEDGCFPDDQGNWTFDVDSLDALLAHVERLAKEM